MINALTDKIGGRKVHIKRIDTCYYEGYNILKGKDL